METIHLKAIVFDHTRYWPSNIVALAERIYQTYLFDASRAVHCCEIMPSFELHPLYATPLVDDDEGTACEEIVSHHTDDIEYHHVSSINRLNLRFIEDLGEHAVDADETIEEAFERLMDHYRGNVVLQKPKPEFRQAA